MEGSSSSDAITATQSYITALDNFQNNGVIVFSSGNYSGESDVSAVAALQNYIPSYLKLGLLLVWLTLQVMILVMRVNLNSL